MAQDRSRYRDAERYTVPGPDDREVVVAEAAPRPRPVPIGIHLRREGERLDHLAARYLADPAGFWRICDAAGVMVPEALADAREVPIPGEAT